MKYFFSKLGVQSQKPDEINFAVCRVSKSPEFENGEVASCCDSSAVIIRNGIAMWAYKNI